MDIKREDIVVASDFDDVPKYLLPSQASVRAIYANKTQPPSNDLEAFMDRARVMFMCEFGFLPSGTPNNLLTIQHEESDRDMLMYLAYWIPGWRSQPTFSSQLLQQLKQLSGSDTIKAVESKARVCIAIHTSKYPKRFQVLNAMLQLDLSIVLMNKDRTRFGQSEYRDGILVSDESIRSKIMSEYDPVQYKSTEVRESRWDMMTHLKDCRYYSPWNWHTLVGQDFCERLQKHFSLSNNIYPQLNYWTWPLFEGFTHDIWDQCDKIAK